MKRFRSFIPWFVLVFILFVILSINSLICVGCSQTMAKKYGGTATVNLPPNTKLINATWKDDEVWSLVRDAKPGELPTTYKLIESSKYGVLEGTVIIKESIK